mmetsp:Transcript_180719/g.573524  ORF Transcript_180719/g.573524 Transcript_180719/m.573524 type:complete len:211 (-) Transcript_180719:584-1216(-)
MIEQTLPRFQTVPLSRPAPRLSAAIEGKPFSPLMPFQYAKVTAMPNSGAKDGEVGVEIRFSPSEVSCEQSAEAEGWNGRQACGLRRNEFEGHQHRSAEEADSQGRGDASRSVRCLLLLVRLLLRSRSAQARSDRIAVHDNEGSDDQQGQGPEAESQVRHLRSNLRGTESTPSEGNQNRRARPNRLRCGQACAGNGDETEEGREDEKHPPA